MRLQFVITIKEIKFKFSLIPQMMNMPQVKVSQVVKVIESHLRKC